MSKEIKYWDDARSKMFAWIESVAKTVSITMWPKWRNVVLDKDYGSPLLTNDWVTIAKEIVLEDKFENMGAALVIEAAEKTNSIAWDGTTTATVLTYALAKEGLRYIKAWVNAVELKNGMRKAWFLISDELEKNAKKVEGIEEIKQVATISAQDEEVWSIISAAMDKVWNTGVISVEEGQTFWLEVEITEGMEFDSWYMSPYMVTNTEKMLAESKDVNILLTDGQISNMKDLLPLLESMMQAWIKDLVIIAEDIQWEALTTIILNKLKWILNVLAIKSPWFGDNKKELLKDIAILTWANIITSDLAMKLENVTLNDLWKAKWVISSKDKTTIIWWAWKSSSISSRVEELKDAMSSSDSNYDKEKLAERIAKLAWWVALIKVWAFSEVEMKEKKLRIEDALNATRAAVEEWVVIWWWSALLKASKILTWVDFWNADQNIWAEIVAKALIYPVKQIVENAWKEWSVVINKILESGEVDFWYDAASDKYVNMISAWIIDPKKVVRVALEEAISLASMFLTTDSAIVEKPWKETNLWWAWMPSMPWMWGMPMM